MVCCIVLRRIHRAQIPYRSLHYGIPRSAAAHTVATGPGGERLAEVDGVQRLVVLATERDLTCSGFSGLDEGICELLPRRTSLS